MRGHAVMLSAAKGLDAQRDRPFAEFTLSGSEGTQGDTVRLLRLMRIEHAPTFHVGAMDCNIQGVDIHI
jgi:hypothetical protein